MEKIKSKIPIRVFYAAIALAILCFAVFGWRYERITSPILPPPLTTEENKLLNHYKPTRNATLVTETVRACWTVHNSKVEICIRRDIKDETKGGDKSGPKR